MSLGCNATVPTIPLINCCGSQGDCFGKVNGTGAVVKIDSGFGNEPTRTQVIEMIEEARGYLDSFDYTVPGLGGFHHPGDKNYGSTFFWYNRDTECVVWPEIDTRSPGGQSWDLGWAGIRVTRHIYGSIAVMLSRMRLQYSGTPQKWCKQRTEYVGTMIGNQTCETVDGGTIDLLEPPAAEIDAWLGSTLPSIEENYICPPFPYFYRQKVHSDHRALEIVGIPLERCPLIGKAQCCVQPGEGL